MEEIAERKPERLRLTAVFARNAGSHNKRRGDEPARLVAVDGEQFPFARVFARVEQIARLSRDHPLRARRFGERPRSREIPLAAPALGKQQVEGVGEQRVPRKNGVCLPEHLVVGGTSATEVVVVHRGEIVVDEGIRMDALQSQRKRFIARNGRAERFQSRKKEHGKIKRVTTRLPANGLPQTAAARFFCALAWARAGIFCVYLSQLKT